ncbi:MAG TPA: ribonuclease HIII [Chthoniobacterales bacterium]
MPLTTYTAALSQEQAAKLRELLAHDGFEFSEKPHTLYAASKGKLNVAVYAKGPKVLLQGKGTEEFLQFKLEPEILGEAKFGYEEVHYPEMFAPHFGIDESGKGDFFGPLVIAGVYVDRDLARLYLAAGVQDSKRITSDARIRELAQAIREAPGAVTEVLKFPPDRYNELYDKFNSLNRLLAWGHARVIENLAAQRPDCPRALSDQFADPSLIEKALKNRVPDILMEQRTKAESDVAVAAASILARDTFVDWMDRAGKRLGLTLPRGASSQVRETARKLAGERGAEFLKLAAKTHFKTAHEIAPEMYALRTRPYVRPAATKPGDN